MSRVAFQILFSALEVGCFFLILFLIVNFSYLKHRANDFIRSNWSRWFDMSYNIKPFYKYNHVTCYELFLLQMKVNSKTGKRKYRWVYIASCGSHSELLQVAESIYPKLKIVGGKYEE